MTRSVVPAVPHLPLPDRSSSEPSPSARASRRTFLAANLSLLGGAAGTTLAAWTSSAQAAGIETPKIAFPPIQAKTEPPEEAKPLPLEPGKRIGYALVGLGRLTVDEIVPAYAKTRYSKVTALVTGDRAKGLTLAHALGLPDDAVLDYAGYERLADRKDVDAVYVVLPNSLHAEYTVRAARIGKHVLCEKPMANTVDECRQMIDACRQARRMLMIAYRQQYEPMNRALAKMIRDKKLGTVKQMFSNNSQNMTDPSQWRLKRALAGGGALPDVGIYCLNATRFLSGQEPIEVMAQIRTTPGDARFKEVEETVHFQLRFASGLLAQCGTSYGAHLSRFLRVNGDEGWAEMDPTFSYHGLKLRGSHLVDGRETSFEPSLPDADQFANEIDHMSACIATDTEPHTGGAEGLQDMRIVEAIYRAAETGRTVPLDVPAGPVRGPEPQIVV